MRKLLSVMTALVLTFALGATALADGEYATAGDLYQAWFTLNGYESPYPAYVTGVWSTGGSENDLVFGVTKDEAGEAGKEEILRLVADDATVSFVYQTYSYAELQAVQNEIVPHMGESTGAYGCGIYDMENVVHIDVDETNPNAEAFMAEMAERYGDKVAFSLMNGKFIVTEDLLTDASARDGGAVRYYWYVGTAAILLAAAFLLLRRRMIPAAVTCDGAVTAESSPLTTRQVEEMYREGAVSPTGKMDEKILSTVKKDS